jgi:hypothetical protein
VGVGNKKMKKTDFKRILIGLAAVSILCVTSALNVYGQATSGEVTPDITWQIEDGTLYIRGKGTVPTTMVGTTSQWSDSRSLFSAVVIEEGVVIVGKFVFNGYKNVVSLSIASSVKFIHRNAFSLCSKLATVEVKSAIPPNILVVTFASTNTKKVKLIVPAGTKAQYASHPFWKKFGTIEESNQPAVDAEKMTATLDSPCTVHLHRTTSFSGGGSAMKISLNGVEQGKLSNGGDMEMQTDRLVNKITVSWGKMVMTEFYFEGVSGGEVKMKYSAATNNYVIEGLGEEDDDEEEKI